MVTLGLNATVNGGTATGTNAESYNVFAGTNSGVGPMTMTSSATATRR